jgi:hypothetical protein
VAALALQAHKGVKSGFSGNPGKKEGVDGVKRGFFGSFVKGSGGVQQLQEDFNTCSDISSDLDMAVFMSDLMGNVQVCGVC